MARWIVSTVVVGLLAALAVPALADEELEVDSTWNYQPSAPPVTYQPSTYQPNPKAVIHRKALERAAHRANRLESKYASGILPARPTINPLNGSWQYTYPVGYVYGPPIVSDDWGNTQVTTLGDGNRTVAPWLVGSQPNTLSR